MSLHGNVLQMLVVPGLRDGEPTRISPNGARLPEEQPSTKPDSDPSEWN